MHYIAHRGASLEAPENTMASFRLALAQGADGIECDLHACQTGEVVVLHDATLDRTTTGTGAVAEITCAALAQLRIQGSDERVPLLEEMLRELGRKTQWCLELKAPDAWRAVVACLQQWAQKETDLVHTCVISFHHEALASIHTVAPNIPLGASFDALPEDFVARALQAGADRVLPHFAELTRAQVEEAHRAGLQVYVWTVNDRAAALRLEAMGVDGIISDAPNRLK